MKKLFSEELTELGKEIGLKNSFFTNSTGWPDPQHLMTLDDLLTLSIRTLEDFPEFFHYYAEKEFTYSGIKQLNRNPLLFTEQFRWAKNWTYIFGWIWISCNSYEE